MKTVKTLLLLLATGTLLAAEHVATIGLIHPNPRQIRNLETLFEKDFLPLPEIRILAIYHQDENEDYGESHAYVAANRLEYVEFVAVRGKVGIAEIYRQNLWTEQFREIFERVDGLIFTGGMDLPPELYGSEKSLMTDDSTPQRSYYEASLLFHLLKGDPAAGWPPLLETRPDFPILTICLGTQTLNAALGGTLHQDIPSELYSLATVEDVLAMPPDKIHSSVYLEKKFSESKNLPPHFHHIRSGDDAIILKSFLPNRDSLPQVLSAHHQCIGTLAPDLKVSARSLDGRVIEAVEHRKFANLLGVQFHPEVYTIFLKGYRYTSHQGKSVSLFREILAKEPNSAFYRRLWAWFAEKVLKESKRDRSR
jgi:putative glutamine amidotransferase